jgi:hypothetical protein
MGSPFLFERIDNSHRRKHGARSQQLARARVCILADRNYWRPQAVQQNGRTPWRGRLPLSLIYQRFLPET